MAVKGLNTSSWRHKILTEIITNNKWLHHFILPRFFVLRCIYIWWWMDIVQELCESRGGHPGLSVLTRFPWTQRFIEPCFGIGHNLSLICQLTSEDIKHQLIIIMMNGYPILMVSVDVKQHWINDEWFDKYMPMLHVLIFDWILRMNTGMSEMSYLGQFYSWKRKGIKWCIWFQF